MHVKEREEEEEEEEEEVKKRKKKKKKKTKTKNNHKKQKHKAKTHYKQRMNSTCALIYFSYTYFSSVPCLNTILLACPHIRNIFPWDIDSFGRIVCRESSFLVLPVKTEHSIMATVQQGTMEIKAGYGL